MSLGCVKALVVTDLFYKLLAFVLLMPTFNILFRLLLALRGQSVLADIDIANFFISSAGLLSAVLLGSVWLLILAGEQSSLLAILAAASQSQTLSSFESLRFAASRTSRILQVSSRIMIVALALAVPFALVAFVTYSTLLGEYDINFYLNEKPFEFRCAVTIGIVLGILLASIFIRLFSNWFLALPLVLFETISAPRAMVESRRMVGGYRKRVVGWLVVWIAIVSLANWFAALLVNYAGHWLIPDNLGSLTVLAARTGLLLLCGLIISTLLNSLITIGFAYMLFRGYLKIRPGARAVLQQCSLPAEGGNRRKLELTRTRLAVFSVLGFLVAGVACYSSISALELEDKVQVMAHRGASTVAPENSTLAIEEAIQAGADWVEIDVQETADGEVVVIHDSDLMKLAGNALKIWDATLEDLRTIDIGSSMDPRFSNLRVPKLSDILELCKGRVGVVIELKYYGHDQQLEQRVVDIVEHFDMVESVMIMSLKPDGIAKLKALRPDWICGVLMSVAVGKIESIQADFLAVNAKYASRQIINRSHKVGKKFYVWTVDNPQSVSMMIDRGADGILTNRPEVVREVLSQRAVMDPSEKLLTHIATFFGK